MYSGLSISSIWLSIANNEFFEINSLYPYDIQKLGIILKK